MAQALRLDYRFYNASLVNFDDLVGIPVPDEQQRSLRYIATPTAIWDAVVVFIDEINRTKPELQNKLFPIIHERRVQGQRLDKLRYRWAAMNPPPRLEDPSEEEVYLGVEPLDPALADRFTFFISSPSWQDLADAEKRAMLTDQFKEAHPFPGAPIRRADCQPRLGPACFGGGCGATNRGAPGGGCAGSLSGDASEPFDSRHGGGTVGG